MGRLANISGRETAKAFQRAGWQPLGQVGSHLLLVKPGVRANLSVPQHKELSVGTLRALIRAAGMTVEATLAGLMPRRYSAFPATRWAAACPRWVSPTKWKHSNARRL